MAFDIELRKAVSAQSQRGQVTVKVALVQEGVSPDIVKRQVEQLKLVKQLYSEVAKELGLDTESVLSLPFLLEQKQSFAGNESEQKEDKLKEDLLLVMKEALLVYIHMKEVEGKALATEILKYLENFKKLLGEIEKNAPDASLAYKKKLLDKIAEVKALDTHDEERILREVMIYAEKVDIEEEITRLKSHIQQFEQLFSSKEKSVGRTMDFLLQEMNREVNTMCAKSDMIDISMHAVKMKSELEKIREQAQNIE